jgi:hypothetical protein
MLPRAHRIVDASEPLADRLDLEPESERLAQVAFPLGQAGQDRVAASRSGEQITGESDLESALDIGAPVGVTRVGAAPSVIKACARISSSSSISASSSASSASSASNLPARLRYRASWLRTRAFRARVERHERARVHVRGARSNGRARPSSTRPGQAVPLLLPPWWGRRVQAELRALARAPATSLLIRIEHGQGETAPRARPSRA